MFKKILLQIPVLGKLVHAFYNRYFVHRQFTTSAQYWEQRYKKGGDSGAGSYHHAAAYKATVINRFVAEHGIQTVIEFGCGDGNQLRYISIPSYLGFDVSETAVSRCRHLFREDGAKRFALLKDYKNETAELTLSLDVIYHLVEDPVFHHYMATLFAASRRYVIIYSSHTADNTYRMKAAHVRNRLFTGWVTEHAPNFTLLEHIPAPSPAGTTHPDTSLTDFFIYQKNT